MSFFKNLTRRFITKRRRRTVRELPRQPSPSPFQSSPFQSSPFQPSPLQSSPFQSSPFQSSPRQPLPRQPLPRQPLPRQPLPRQPSPRQPLPRQPLPPRKLSPRVQSHQPSLQYTTQSPKLVILIQTPNGLSMMKPDQAAAYDIAVRQRRSNYDGRDGKSNEYHRFNVKLNGGTYIFSIDTGNGDIYYSFKAAPNQLLPIHELVTNKIITSDVVPKDI
jgi:hypothetical protein